MSWLVIVSSCVADPQCETSGEFAVSILQGLREHGGLWFGWNGSIVADESKSASPVPLTTMSPW